MEIEDSKEDMAANMPIALNEWGKNRIANIAMYTSNFIKVNGGKCTINGAMIGN